MMIDAQHTPGPWRERSKSEGVYIESMTGHVITLVQLPFGERCNAAMHDARLIADAPALLRALAEFVDTVDDLDKRGDFVREVEVARRLLRHATGDL